MKTYYSIAISSILIHILLEQSVASPNVETREGKLSGTWMRTRGGRRVAAFRGIPYATPPVGELRFQSPKPPISWSGVRLAVADGHRCVQHNPFLGVYGEEDCLVLNVFTPQVSADPKLPVLFFIHGGAFKGGSGGSYLYGPDYLLDEDVVLVTINYRLGVFGFLSLGDEVLPGNLGLKDQRAALRWVKANIAQFGGDPSAVTLFGESAGAASAHYHMLFNAEEGLFRAGILHSGAVFTSFFQRPDDQKPLVEYILEKTGCSSDNSSVIVDCLKKIRPYKLTRIVASFSPPYGSLLARMELTPVIEPDCVEDIFVYESPWNKNTSMPIIIGTNQYETLFMVVEMLKDGTNKQFEEFDSNYEEILPYNMMFKTSAKNPTLVARQLREFYLNNHSVDREHILDLVNLLSDGIFTSGLIEAINHNSNESYVYSFNYLGSKSLLNILGHENSYGPCHVDELFLFFPMSFGQAYRRKINETNDKIMSHKLVKMWINFANNMKPTEGTSTVEWDSVIDDMEYLSIDGPHNLTMETGFFSDRSSFWASLPFRDKPLPDTIPCIQN